MYDYKNKTKNVTQSNSYMMAKTLSMFEWEGLPETIPYQELEKLLQVNGYAFVTEVEGELYAFTGGMGGLQDVYGNPTEITINNVALKFNKTLDLKKDGVLLRSDDLMLGLKPILTKYHTIMCENDINMVVHGYNGRISTMISASDDKTKASAEAMLTKVVAGEMAVIGETALFDGVKTHQAGRQEPITSLIEFQQYMKASMYNEIGLNANFNMKRERLNSAEVLQNEDTIYPFVDNMMKCRLSGVEKINEMFGTEIDVDYGSVWADKKRERVDNIVGNEIEVDDETNKPVNARDREAVAALEAAERGEVIDEPETTPVDVVEVKTDIVEDVEIIEDKPEVVDSVDEDQTQPKLEVEPEPVVEEEVEPDELGLPEELTELVELEIIKEEDEDESKTK